MRKAAIPLIALLFGFVLAPQALAFPPYSECQGWTTTSSSSATGYSCQDAEYNLYMNLVAYTHGCPGPYYQACNVQFYPSQACQGDCDVYEVAGFFGYGCEICVHYACMP